MIHLSHSLAGILESKIQECIDAEPFTKSESVAQSNAVTLPISQPQPQPQQTP